MSQEDLDEYFDYEVTLNRMLDKIPDTLDKREGSIIYDALAPAAAEIAQMYIVLKNNIDLVFADTAVEEYLDRLANQIGLTREKATKAVKQGNFYDKNENPMDVAIGSRFTCGNLYWNVTEKISEGTYQVTCETDGVDGNNVTGILVPVDYIDGLATATLTTLLIPGEDEEDDDSLRARYFEQSGVKAFAGNVIDYKNNTKAISGVGSVKVTPIWNGPGTVKLTILDSEFNKASSVLVSNVQNEICPDLSAEGLGLAPIGHVVTVDTATEVEISVEATVTTDGTVTPTTLQTLIEEAIENYLLEIRQSWEDETTHIIRKARVESIILNVESVLDVSNVTLNEENSNITLNEFEIPVLKEVVIS